MNVSRQTIGAVLCLVCAAMSAAVIRESRLKTFLPFLFIAVIAAIASRFGAVSGILGAIGSAFIFAAFLFEPFYSLRVSDSTQRSRLIWMVIGGMILSEILGSHPSADPRSRNIRVSRRTTKTS